MAARDWLNHLVVEPMSMLVVREFSVGDGRPTKLTPEMQAAIIADIEAGNSLECAAECQGIHKDTAYAWYSSGLNGEAECVAFYLAVTRARAAAEKTAVESLRNGMTGNVPTDEKGRPLADWRAGESWLKRARFRRWGDKQLLEAKVERAAEDLSRLSREELVTYYELRMKTMANEGERLEMAKYVEALKLLPVKT